jgi:hypothetical protein
MSSTRPPFAPTHEVIAVDRHGRTRIRYVALVDGKKAYSENEWNYASSNARTQQLDDGSWNYLGEYWRVKLRPLA